MILNDVIRCKKKEKEQQHINGRHIFPGNFSMHTLPTEPRQMAYRIQMTV